jgi:SAM-dependent methyltransferase
VVCAALFADYVGFVRGGVIELSRNFYGTLRVSGSPDGDPSPVASRRLLHGVILHGEQYLAPDARAIGTTYYGPTSGIGRTIEAMGHGGPMRVALIGLGVGTLATYGREGDVYRLYELNPEVLEVAKRHFTYLKDSRATLEPALGDARLVLEREPPQRFDVLAVDAFSSDSIPVHLLTREALAVYRRHLSPGGTVVFHITNRYLDLSGVVQQLAEEADLHVVRFRDEPPPEAIQYRSDWIAVTADAELAKLLWAAGGEPMPPMEVVRRPWTDDHHNLFEVLK